MRSLFRISPAVLLVAAACGGVASDNAAQDDLAPATVGATPQGRLKHALPPKGASTLSFRTLPNATCTIRPANEAPGAQERLKLYADDHGLARLHIQDTAGQIQGADFALDCVNPAGRTITHALRLDVVAGARPQAPAKYETAGLKRLPAPDKDPRSMSPAEIAARGYPPRPDAAQLPAQYQKWEAMVRSAPAVLDPVRVDDGRKHSYYGSSSNWSGYVITTGASAPQYGEIFGAWRVPQAYAEGGFWHLNYSSLWVGMDGWGTPDVVQDGTDQNTQTIFWAQFSSYGAWTEWYPYTSQSVSNFPVNPGDTIWAWTWVGTSNDTWSATGGVGWFYLYNASQNVSSGYISTAAPSGTYFNGHQAEWVMERPTVGGSVANLANYSSATIFDAWAYDFAYNAHYYGSDASWNLSMYNGSDLLSTVAPVDSMTMQFAWHNYN